MSDEGPYLLQLDLGPNGGSPRFKSAEDVAEWYSTEKTFWLSFAEGHLRQHVLSTLSPINQAATALKNNPGNRNAISTVENAIKTVYQQGQLIHSASDRGAFLAKLRDGSKSRASHAALCFLSVDGPLTAAWVFGAVDVGLFNHGISTEVAEARQTAFRTFMAKAEQAVGERQSELESLCKRHQEHEGKASLQLAEQETLFQEKLKEIENRMAELEKTYNEYMAVKAPVDYWEKKRTGHRKWKWGYAVAAIFLGACGVASLLLVLWMLFPEDIPAEIKEAVHHWHTLRFTATLVILATFFFWLERILVRVYLSHAHLEIDAEERVAITKSYLALLREKDAITPEERKIVLEQLFRHAATGIVKTDSAPPHPIELITRGGGSKQE